MSDFNPYHQWLGISETARPVSKYRLLGIDEFESDRDVISAAAEQRTIYLRTLQAGEHEVLVAQLLNEVSQARVTLLNADQKAEYDEELRKQQAPHRKVQEEIWKRPAVIGISVVGVIAVLVFVISLMFSGDADPVASNTAGRISPLIPSAESTPEPESESEPKTPEPKLEPEPAIAPKPAVVLVERLSRVPFTIEADSTLLPPVLQGATTWKYLEPKSASQANGVLRFEVIESGEVYLVANWKYAGNRSGGWYEERLTREQLVERGWMDLGPAVWDREVYLLKRQVEKGESYVLRTSKYWPPALVIRGNPNSPAITRPRVSIDQQARAINGLGDHLEGKSVATIRIFNREMAVYRPFEVIPKTMDGKKQLPGWNKVPLVLSRDYVHSSPVHHRGVIEFDIIEEGVVLAAVTAHEWGDRGLSGGEWQETVQSFEQLTESGWHVVEPAGDSGLAEWSYPKDRLLIYRVCKKGEVLHLRTKKYSTPIIIIPAMAIPPQP
jgi:hypothetical protein